MIRFLLATSSAAFVTFISLYYSGFLSAVGRIIIEVIFPAMSDNSENINTRTGFLPVAINVSFLFYCVLNGVLTFWLIYLKLFTINTLSLLIVSAMLLIISSTLFWPGQVLYRALTIALINFTIAASAAIWLWLLTKSKLDSQWQRITGKVLFWIVLSIGVLLPLGYGLYAAFVDINLLEEHYDSSDWISIIVFILSAIWTYKLALKSSQ